MPIVPSKVTKDMFVAVKTADDDRDSDEEEDYYFSDID